MARLERLLCATLRAQLAGGKDRPPEAGRYLWQVFAAISRTRTYQPAGPNALQPSEIEALCRIMRIPMEPHHIGIILAMDVVWLDFFYDQRSRKRQGETALPPVSKRPITAGMFDAMLG